MTVVYNSGSADTEEESHCCTVAPIVAQAHPSAEVTSRVCKGLAPSSHLCCSLFCFLRQDIKD